MKTLAHITSPMMLFGAAVFACLTSLVVGVPHAHAVGPNTAAMLTAEIVLKPKSPAPLTEVEARVKSYSFDATRALITWRENGKVVQQARGGDEYRFRTGPIGSLTVIEVSLETLDGRVVNTSRSIRPAYVGVTWEARTYTPLLYKGKALQSPGSFVTFTAIPTFIDSSGKEIPAENLVYLWKQGTFPMQNMSGYGKRSVTLMNSKYLETLRIAVEVSNMDRTLIANGEVFAPVSQPTLILYEQSPLLGMRFERAIPSAYTLRGEEVAFIAEPYYFSVKNREDALLTYEWKVGNAPVAARGTITLRPEGSGSGTSPVTLVLRHTKEILQSARAALSVRFNTGEQERNDPAFFSL